MMVFVFLRQDSQRHPADHVLAKCASVCRDWQAVFECRIFRHLRLTQSCLNQFSSIVEGKNQYRFALIQDLHFQVVLDEYSCKDCQIPESKALHARQVTLGVLVLRRY
jgi:hypothetical protein